MVGHTRYDRLLSVPIATALVMYPYNTWSKRAYVTATVVGLCVAATKTQCDSLVYVSSDVCALVAGAYQVFSSPVLLSKSATASLVEASAIVLVISMEPTVIADRESHLTWWGLVTLALFDYACARGSADYVYVTALLLHVAIVAGVLWMSGSKCDLLIDAHNQVGPAIYVIFNFLMHYWPTIRILAYRPAKLVQPEKQALVAACLQL